MPKTSKSATKLVLLDSQNDKEDQQIKPPKIGGARGIESMFRNSYRAQLDMISLAATKANIMISLNGLLVSMLLVSGAYFLSSDPLLLIPVSTLLITCTVAIVFAVLAARPNIDRKVRSHEDYRNDRGELLTFSQFTSLSSDEYHDAMHEMMQDNQRIYANMTGHLYFLGVMADQKFSRLYVSYTAFIIGLVISVASLITVVIYHASTVS